MAWAVLAISLVLTISGYYLQQVSAQRPETRPGHQPDGTFIRQDGTHYTSQQASIDAGLCCGVRDDDADSSKPNN
ncbi:MAG: hypothetical protein JST84_25005 [Acidobacteria bacterium]|nr:hypothetical protein [Acidobacteriota bacterium]